jgi:molybdopterin-containing oxidoreductase family iron-sulfur binding subunit
VCPARAITFGDLNDPRSRASRLAAGRRHYTVLEELNLKPSIGYLKIIRQES